MVVRMPCSSMWRMSNTWRPSVRMASFSSASTLRMPMKRIASGGSAARSPLQPVSTAGPWPSRHDTGMPCRLPLGLVVSVLTSECASSHSTRSLRPRLRACQATALIEPIARQWSPPSISGTWPAPSTSSTAAYTARFQAITSSRWRSPLAGGAQGVAGPARLPRSTSAKPWRTSASASPATRSASGPMPAPRTLAPTSVGAPISSRVRFMRGPSCPADPVPGIRGARRTIVPRNR